MNKIYQNKFLLILAICVAVVSFVAKFQNRNHGIHYFQNYYSLHLAVATNLFNDFPDGEKSYADIYKRCMDYEPLGYPLGLTLVYLTIADYSSDIQELPGDFLKLIKKLRVFHISFFLLAIIVLFYSPFDRSIKWLAIFLVSVSLIYHQYSCQIRVHAISGVIAFVTFLYVLKFSDIKNKLVHFAPISLMIGLSSGVLFSGAICYFSFVLLLFHLLWRQKITIKRVLFYATTSFLIWFSVFIFFFPNMYRMFIDKSATFIRSGNYDDKESLVSCFGLKGYQGYLSDFFGIDLFFGLTYLLGFVFFFKYKKYKEEKWFVIFFTVLIYLVMMGSNNHYTARFMSFIIPFMSIIAAFGLISLYQINKKISLIVMIPLALFSMMNIARYNYLMANDTREIALKYVDQHIPPGSRIVIDMGLPVFASKDADGTFSRKVETVLIDSIPLTMINYFKKNSDEYQIFSNQVNDHRTLEEVCFDSKYFPLFLEFLDFDYYVTNRFWKYYSGKKIAQQGMLIKKWHITNSNVPQNDWFWPPDSNNFYMWKMWDINYGGPLIEIYQLR